jgi:hypothetical protein
MFCSVTVRETELSLTCSVQFGQNGKTLLRSVTIGPGKNSEIDKRRDYVYSGLRVRGI